MLDTEATIYIIIRLLQNLIVSKGNIDCLFHCWEDPSQCVIDLFKNVKIDDILFFLRERQGYAKKYDKLKLINHVQTNEILLIKNFTY